MIYITVFLIVIIFLGWGIEKLGLQIPFIKKGIFFFLVLVLGVRYQVGVDYPTYEDIYNAPLSVHQLSIEPLWLLINNLLRGFGFGARGFFFLTSFVIVWGYYSGIRKMSPDFYISVLLFIVCGFYFDSANIIRQYVAAAILFATFHLYVKGRIWRYLLCIFLAALFHYSVLIIFPFILLARLKYPRWLLGIVLLLSSIWGDLLLNIMMERFTPYLAEISRFQYSIDDFDSGVSTGLLKIFYNLIGLFVLLTIYWGKDRSASVDLFVNMMIFGIVFYNVFYLFMPARRLYLYFFPYLIICFPYCLKKLELNTRILILGIIVIVFLIFLLKTNWDVPYDFDFQFFNSL